MAINIGQSIQRGSGIQLGTGIGSSGISAELDPNTPLTIPDLLNWEDCSDIDTVTTVSGFLRLLTDKAGNGLDYDQPSATNRGLYLLNDQNGLNGVSLDGINDFLDRPHDNLLNTGNNFTMYFVFKTTSDSGFMYQKNQLRPQINITAGGANVAIQKSAGGGGTFRNVSITKDVANNLIWAKNGTSGFVSLNGVDVTEPYSNFTLSNTSFSAALGSNSGGTASFLKFVFYEMMIYSRALNSNELNLLAQYAQGKWGL